MRFWLACALILIVFPVLGTAGPIVNGGFETGSFTGWTQSGDTSFTSVSCGGGAAEGQCYSSFGPTGGLGYITQTIQTIPGLSYWITFWLSNPTSDVTSQFVVDWDESQVLGMDGSTTFDWTAFRIETVASGTTTDVRFGFYNSPSYWYFDGVDVNTTPEASSLGLIGLGLSALALLRRKRG